MDIDSQAKPGLQLANLSEQVYRQIKQDILRKEICCGSNLVEQELCERYGVSRTPVREAIQMLSSDGIVEKKKHHSTRIIEMSKREVRSLIQVRMELEIVSLIEIAPHFSKEDHSCLASLHQRCLSTLERNDLVDFYETDSRFHLDLAQRSRNPFLYEAYRKIDSKLQLLRSIEHSRREQIVAVLNMHQDILDRLGTGDLEGAIATMRAHVLASMEFIAFGANEGREPTDGR